MSEIPNNLSTSIDLAKLGFENAQNRISAIDAKVGVAVGFLVVLLPGPLLVAGWLLGLESTIATKIFESCTKCWFASSITALCSLLGMLCAFAAILRGFSSLTPRGPKGYGVTGAFQNEWRPNVLFPLFRPDKHDDFCFHLRKLHSGIDLTFVIEEFDHQLQQLGRILDAKFSQMSKCFWWLAACLASYGIAILSSTWIAFATILEIS